MYRLLSGEVVPRTNVKKGMNGNVVRYDGDFRAYQAEKRECEQGPYEQTDQQKAAYIAYLKKSEM
jgi:hypothetical protein